MAVSLNVKTKNLRAVQLLFGRTKLESTVRYLGIEGDDALEMVGERALAGQQRPLVRKARMAEDTLGLASPPRLAFVPPKRCPHTGGGVHGRMLALKQPSIS